MLFKISFKITNEISISYSNIWALNQMCIFPGLELLGVPYYRANPPLFRICTFLSRDYGGGGPDRSNKQFSRRAICVTRRMV